MNDEPAPKELEPTRKSKGDRNKDNIDDYTYSLYDEAAYQLDYYYASSYGDYSAFDTYTYDSMNYYYGSTTQFDSSNY